MINQIFKKTAILSISLMFAFSIIQCNGDDDNGDGDGNGDEVTGPPSAPAVTSPAEGDDVTSPVTIIGTGEAGAVIEAVISSASRAGIIGTAESTAKSDGSFNFTLTYTNQPGGTALLLSVSQTTENGTSDAKAITIYQAPPVTISGDILDSTGFPGAKVYVRLYDSNTEILNHLQEKIIDVTNGSQLEAGDAPFSFTVAQNSGSYYIRAYRDTGSLSDWMTPDGLPTLKVDAQAPVSVAIGSSSNSTGNDLTLADTTGEDIYENFNAYSYNESAHAEPPYYDDGDDWVPGSGLCRGYYLKLKVNDFSDDSGTLSAPAVKVTTSVPLTTDAAGEPLTWADDHIVTLLDDGGTGEAVHDNTNLSYDGTAGDNEYGFGIRNPDSAHAGDYILHYRNSDGYIHIEKDTVDPVVKISRRIILSDPTGDSALTDLNPPFAWNSIANAASYQLNLTKATDYGYYRNETTTTNSISDNPFSSDLDDDCAYRVSISAFDIDITSGGDMDAMSSGINNYFTADAAEDSTITISGDITNETDETTSDYCIFGTGSTSVTQIMASVILPPGTGSYTLTVLGDTGANKDAMAYGFIDVTGSCDIDENENYSVAATDLDGSADLTGIDFHFRPPLLLDSPEDGATGLGDTPAFSWFDYSADAPPVWSYVLYNSAGGDPPEVLWGLPNTTISFDWASPPAEREDVNELTGGDNPADLSGYTDWSWGVVCVECDYTDANDDAGNLFPGDGTTDIDDGNPATNDYQECLLHILSSEIFYQMSADREFTTD